MEGQALFKGARPLCSPFSSFSHLFKLLVQVSSIIVIKVGICYTIKRDESSSNLLIYQIY